MHFMCSCVCQYAYSPCWHISCLFSQTNRSIIITNLPLYHFISNDFISSSDINFLHKIISPAIISIASVKYPFSLILSMPITAIIQQRSVTYSNTPFKKRFTFILFQVYLWLSIHLQGTMLYL